MRTRKERTVDVDPRDEDSDEYRGYYDFAWRTILGPSAKEQALRTLEDEMELGRWPDDDRVRQEIEQASSLSALTGMTEKRRQTYQQVLRARERERELRSHDPSLFERATGAVRDLFTPQPPSVPQSRAPLPHEVPLGDPSTSRPSTRIPRPTRSPGGSGATPGQEPSDRTRVNRQLQEAKALLDEAVRRAVKNAKGDGDRALQDPLVQEAYDLYKTVQREHARLRQDAQRAKPLVTPSR